MVYKTTTGREEAFGQRDHVTGRQPIALNGCGYHGDSVFTIAGCPGAQEGGRNDSAVLSIDGVESAVGCIAYGEKVLVMLGV